MLGHTNPALPRPCPAHVFFSSQLTLSQTRREQRQLYIIVLQASARTFILPSHPSCRDLVGQNHAWSLPPQMHLHKHGTGAPWAQLGGQREGRQRRNAPPPSSHNEPIVGGAGGGIGEQDRPRRQTHEAAGGDAKGSRYREFSACDLQLQCLKSPHCDGKNNAGLQPKAKAIQKATEKRTGSTGGSSVPSTVRDHKTPASFCHAGLQSQNPEGT